MAPMKPEFELFDLKNDPWEVHNLADDPEYSGVKSKLLKELNNWRKEINDQGVGEGFRSGGWPPDYPTRTLEEWERRLADWEPWVFREPDSKMKHPKTGW